VNESSALAVIKKDFQPTLRAGVNATREIFRRTWVSKLFYAFFLGGPVLLLSLGVVLSIVWRDTAVFDTSFWVGVLGGPLFVFVFWPFCQYLNAYLNWRTNPTSRVRQTIEISESGVRASGEGFAVDLSWDRIVGVTVSKRFVLVLISKYGGLWMPSELFSDDEVTQIQQWKATFERSA